MTIFSPDELCMARELGSGGHEKGVVALLSSDKRRLQDGSTRANAGACTVMHHFEASILHGFLTDVPTLHCGSSLDRFLFVRTLAGRLQLVPAKLESFMLASSPCSQLD